MVNELLKQLKVGKAAADLNLSLQLSVIKPLHAKWIVDLLSFLKDDKEKTMNGFRAAGITETVNDAKNVIERVENSFMED